MAVVDVSKEFYHFPTRPEERNYLGLIHPVTGQHLRYKGLPMGSSSSPSAAGKGWRLCSATSLRTICSRAR